MIGLFGRQGPAATLGQQCPQMTQRPGSIHTIRRISHARCKEHKHTIPYDMPALPEDARNHHLSVSRIQDGCMLHAVYPQSVGY